MDETSARQPKPPKLSPKRIGIILLPILLLFAACTVWIVNTQTRDNQTNTRSHAQQNGSSCTHNASSQAEIDSFIAGAQPGQTLCLTDGTGALGNSYTAAFWR
jgi:hypothetical protein